MDQFPFKIQADIYRIDEDSINEPVDDFIDGMMDSHSANSENYKYLRMGLVEEIESISDFSVRLYISEDRETDLDWIDFVSSIVTEEDQENLRHLKRKYPSFLLFIHDDSSIYVVTKGAGRYVLSGSMTQNFGIEILERLIDPEKSDIRSVSERGVVGSILAQQRYFKPDFKIGDDRSFGKFYKSVQAFISKEKLDKYLGIKTSRTSLIIGGENTLKINNKIDISELVDRIEKLRDLMALPKTFHINKFRKLRTVELNRIINGTTLESDIESKLLDQIFAQWKKGEEIEIYHPSIFDYLLASSLKFYRREGDQEFDISTSFRITLGLILQKLDLIPTTRIEFENALKYAFGGFIVSDNPYQAAVSLTQWITGEVSLNDKRFFKFDGAWYTYEDIFIDSINLGVTALLKKMGNKVKLPDWPYSAFKAMGISNNEHVYNQSLASEGYIICDTALIQGIEICDFFKIEDGELNLFHVKQGWGQNTRVVYSQILNSARLLHNILSNGDTNILKKYHRIVQKQNYKGKSVDIQNFIDFQNCEKIKFTLVYATNKPKERNKEIMESASNIAKLSILQCETDLRSNFGYDFQIVKVKII